MFFIRWHRLVATTLFLRGLGLTVVAFFVAVMTTRPSLCPPILALTTHQIREYSQRQADQIHGKQAVALSGTLKFATTAIKGIVTVAAT